MVKPVGRLRDWHRWLSIVVGLQLLAWTVSGLIFTWDPIEVVRGEAAITRPAAPTLPADASFTAPVRADATTVTLCWRRERWAWEAHDADGALVDVVDAATGASLEPLDRDGARTIAERAYVGAAPAASVEPVANAAGEYRGKPLPAFRVAFDDDESTHVYVHARSGEITTVRTDTWRRFDWFWMLHVMDYDEREDFSHPLIQAAALLGVATALTGLALAVVTLRARAAARRKTA